MFNGLQNWFKQRVQDASNFQPGGAGHGPSLGQMVHPAQQAPAPQPQVAQAIGQQFGYGPQAVRAMPGPSIPQPVSNPIIPTLQAIWQKYEGSNPYFNQGPIPQTKAQMTAQLRDPNSPMFKNSILLAGSGGDSVGGAKFIPPKLPAKLSSSAAAKADQLIAQGQTKLAALNQAIKQNEALTSGESGFAKLNAKMGGGKPPAETPANAPIPPGQKQRGFVTSIKEKPNEFSPTTQQAVNATYMPQTHAGWQSAAENFTKGRPLSAATEEAQRILSGQLPAGQEGQVVTTIGHLAYKLDQAGQHETATNLLNQLSEKGTNLGQGVNAFSLALHRSPIGLTFQAKKQLSDAGVKVTPQIEQEIKAAVSNLSKAAEGDAKNIAGQQLFKTVASHMPPSKPFDKFFGIWRAGLLSGPQTVTKVALSHSMVAPFELAAKAPAYLTDRAASLFTGKRTMSLAPEQIPQAAKGFVRGLKAAGTNVKSGIEMPRTGGFGTEELAQAGTRGVRYDTSKPLGNAAQHYADFFGRLHGSIFKPFYGAVFDSSLADQAGAEAANQGIKGAEHGKFIQNLIAHPTDEMLANAKTEAEHATLQQRTALGSYASNLQKQGWWGKILAPFTRIPSAIGTSGLVDYTPFGLGKDIVQQVKSGHFNQRQFSLAMGRATSGTGVAALGALLMQQGHMTLSAPADAKERSLWELQGKTPNSIKVGGQWRSLNALGPLGITLGLGGAFQRGLEIHGNNPIQASTEALASAGKLLVDQPYLKGIAGAANALNDPTRSMQTWVDNTAGSVIPTAVATAARATDPLQRDYPKNVVDALKNRIPGLREQVAPNVNVIGQTDQRQGGVAQNLLDPLFSAHPQNVGSPVVNEFQRLYSALGSSEAPTIGEPSRSQTINGQKVKLDPHQFATFLQGSGSYMVPSLTNLVQSPQYQALQTDRDKSLAINKVIAAARNAQQATQLGDQQKPNQNTTTLLGGGTVQPIKPPAAPKAARPPKVKLATTKVAKPKAVKVLKGPGIPKPRSIKLAGTSTSPRAPKVKLASGKVHIAKAKVRISKATKLA